jgi:hypothetical protein
MGGSPLKASQGTCRAMHGRCPETEPWPDKHRHELPQHSLLREGIWGRCHAETFGRVPGGGRRSGNAGSVMRPFLPGRGLAFWTKADVKGASRTLC